MFFSGVTSGTSNVSDVQNLEKALSAGYGTDSATFIDGRAMIPEDLETTVLNVMAQTKEDCKVLNSVKKTTAKSSIHEFVRRTDHGDWRHLTVNEGGVSRETNQSLERATVKMAYLQTRRSVTKQMEIADTFESAYASEKIAGVETITKALEYTIFHGNSDVIPTEFDGFLATIKKSAKSPKMDFRGESIGTKGLSAFQEIAQMIFENGNDVDKVMYPSILSKDIQDLVAGSFPALSWQYFGGAQQPIMTPTGQSIRWVGDDCGADKFFRVKGKITAEGDALSRPEAPASVTATAGAAASGTTSQFVAADAGDYLYTVHAVNASGTSAGTSVAAAVSVGAGDVVTLEITPASSGASATGFIICRSKKDGTEVMEMDTIANSGNATTSYVDTNDELPGTASMVFLPKAKLFNAYDYVQFLPICTMPLYPTGTAEIPFLVLAYGALSVKAPNHIAMAKNVAYSGGLY